MSRRPSLQESDGLYVRVCEECLTGYTSTRSSGIYCPDCKKRRETLRSDSSAHCLEDPSPGAPFRGSIIPHIEFEEGLRFACWPPGSLWQKNGEFVKVVGGEWDGGEAPPSEFRQKIELRGAPGRLRDRVR